MKLEIIDGHSVAVDLLQGGWVLDAGSRGFAFSREMVKRGCKVVALDPDPDVPRDAGDNIFTAQLALGGIGCTPSRLLVRWGNGQANYLVNRPEETPTGATCIPVTECPITYFMRPDGVTERGIYVWDAVKLNIEGSEHPVLGTWPGPIARQIVVSFHEHAHRRGDEEIAKIVAHLGQWYHPVRHVFDERYCAGRNAWDSVFVLRELL